MLSIGPFRRRCPSFARRLACHASQRSPRCSFCTSSSRQPRAIRVCVVGSGPAGCYTVDELHKQLGGRDHALQVDVVERLPAPYGLARYGVAPDHPEAKAVISTYEQVLSRPSVRFLGNVELGRDCTLSQLRSAYDAVVLAYGADVDRRLGIAGERDGGVSSARAFVGWYNGDPMAHHHNVSDSNLRHDTRNVAIVGHGNVAIDVARILLRPVEALETTDIAEEALHALRHTRVDHVHIIGRRGPAQASFTNKELRELLHLPGVDVEFSPSNVLDSLNDASEEEARGRVTRRMIQMMRKRAQAPAIQGGGEKAQRKLSLHFLSQPTRFIQKNGALSGIEIHPTKLCGAAHQQKAMLDEEQSPRVIPCDQAFVAAGYRSTHVQGLPWCSDKGRVHQDEGRVLQGPGGDALPGVYTAGWLKRGPSGIIGTNKWDAEETVGSIVQDLRDGSLTESMDGERAHAHFLAQLNDGARVVDWNGWKRLEQWELQLGASKGKRAEKVIDVEEMLCVAMES